MECKVKPDLEVFFFSSLREMNSLIIGNNVRWSKSMQNKKTRLPIKATFAREKFEIQTLKYYLKRDTEVYNCKPVKHIWWSFLRKQSTGRGHLLSTYAKFSGKLTFLTPLYAHIHVRIRRLEMLFFQKILRTCLLDGSQNRTLNTALG